MIRRDDFSKQANATAFRQWRSWLRGADLNRRTHLRLIHTLCTITHQLLSCKNGYNDEYELLIAVENSGGNGALRVRDILLSEGPMDVPLQQINQNQFSAFL